MLDIRESQIEDILATQLDAIKTMLQVDHPPTLIARQKILPSGNRLDLLFVSANNLHLLELKAVGCDESFCHQTAGYRAELEHLQSKHELPTLPLKAYLLCPSFSSKAVLMCKHYDITPVQYSPYELLRDYFLRASAIRQFVQLKPRNHGLWQLKLLNRIIYEIRNEVEPAMLSAKTGLSISTINSYLSIAKELGMVHLGEMISLSELGKEYVALKQSDMPTEFMSDSQVEALRSFVTSHPFHSKSIYGIYTTVEVIFSLSKNFYPVPELAGSEHFRLLAGRATDWGEKASRDAFKMYSNYSIELGLLARMDNHYYITPAGIRFILLLELNKSILMVNAL